MTVVSRVLIAEIVETVERRVSSETSSGLGVPDRIVVPVRRGG